MFKPSSNTLCNCQLNETFIIGDMPPSASQNVLTKLKDWVKKERLRPGEAAEKLAVDHGRYTNWLRRGVPPKEYPRVAKAIGCTLDELVQPDPASLRYPVEAESSSFNKVQERFERLEPEDQEQLAQIVTDLISAIEGRTKPRSRLAKRSMK